MKLHKHFDSTYGYRAWVAEHLAKDPNPDSHQYVFSHRPENSIGISKGLELLARGDESHVQEARDLLTRFSERIEVEHSYWGHDVAGYFPDVPAYLAGDPENMYVKRFDRSDRTPLRIWVGVTSSAGVYEDQLVQRGVTLAAFALAMIEKRPVIVTPYCLNSDGYQDSAFISWDISTQPLVIGELMASLVRPEIIRYLSLYACGKLNPAVTGRWNRDYQDEAAMRQVLGAKPEDLWLGSIHLYDPLLKDPMQWVKQQLAKYTEE